MASTSQEGNNTTGAGAPAAAAPTTYTAWADLQSDFRSIANQAVYDAALLYPMYMMNYDSQIFSSGDSDMMAAVKLAGLVAGVSEGQKLLRLTLTQAGVNPKIVYPFGVPGAV